MKSKGSFNGDAWYDTVLVDRLDGVNQSLYLYIEVGVNMKYKFCATVLYGATLASNAEIRPIYQSVGQSSQLVRPSASFRHLDICPSSMDLCVDAVHASINAPRTP